MTETKTSHTDDFTTFQLINYKPNFLDYGTYATTKRYIEKLYSTQIYRIFQKLIQCSNEITNPQVKNDTEKLRASLRYKLSILLDRFQLNNIPSINAIIIKDGSVLVEWIFPEFRIVFNIEEKEEESSWNFVGEHKLSHINIFGLLNDSNREDVFNDIFSFVSTIIVNE